MTSPTVALHEIAEVKLGRQRSPKDHDGDQMRPYVRAANIGWSGWKLDDVKSMNFTDSEMLTFRLRSGDLLLSEASGSANEVGKPALWDGQIEDCAFQNTLIRVRPRNADPKYLLHYFNYCAASGQFAQRSRGVGIFHLGRAALAELPVPLPAIEEQRRIAALLDAADALRAKRRQALAKLDTLTQAIFIDMFGDPVANEAAWEVAPLGELLDRIESGKSPVCLDRPAGVGEWGILKAGAVTYCEFDESQTKALPPGVKPDTRHEVRRGDVLFARKNTHDLVAACAYVFASRPRLLMSDLIFRLVIADEQRLDPVFLQSQLVHPRVRKRIQQLAGGSSGSMPNISKTKLMAVEICVPPIVAQVSFAQAVLACHEAQLLMDQDTDRLDDLFASLQQRAFRGEV